MSEYQSVQSLLSEIAIPEKGILSHTLFNDDSVKIILFGFAPGQELTAHTAPMPATIQILAGEATVTLGNDVEQAGPGYLAHMLPQLTHAVTAKTPVLMLLTLVKAARRQTAHQAA